jgi:methionyl-tRNA synthetase
MSKSRGTGISPLRYLELGFNPEWLRYYLCAKLSSKVEDIDFNTDDFAQRVNADLVGKYVNIASRTAGFISKRFQSQLSAELGNEGAALIESLQAQADHVQQFYDEREFAKAAREIMRLSDTVNEYVDQHKPWELAKQESAQEQLHAVCSTCIEAFRLLSIYLKPILPQITSQVEAFLKVPPLQFADAKQRMGSHTIGTYSHLLQRINPEELQGLFESPRD